MADTRFFVNRGPFTLGHLAELAGASMANAADASQVIEDVAPLDSATTAQISFLDNPKYTPQFSESKAGACLVHPDMAATAPIGMALLVTDEPYLAYARVARAFYPEALAAGDGTIHPSAIIDKTASLGENVSVCAGAVIGAGVTIGAGSIIGANATVHYAILGKNVVLHPGVHIGQDGFGFASSVTVGHVRVPQLGRVIIGDGVDIGAGTCVDRGAGPDTIIGRGCQIDNLVQIGHNVVLGDYCVVVSQTGIAGSTKIGKFVVIGGQVGIAGHLHIGDGAKIAAGSGVTKDVPSGATVGGYPAVPVTQWHRQTVNIQKLSGMKKKGSP